jgi:DNA replicative helicase MCM subunit Mcm2 (Cdc46/Mcm family)
LGPEQAQDVNPKPLTLNPKPGKLWDLNKLKMYLSHIKQTFDPVLTEESEDILTAYYKLQRSSGENPRP